VLGHDQTVFHDTALGVGHREEEVSRIEPDTDMAIAMLLPATAPIRVTLTQPTARLAKGVGWFPIAEQYPPAFLAGRTLHPRVGM